MATAHRVDPRVRAYGKARIDVTRRAQSESEWQASWREPRYSFPFHFGKSWKMCVQYLVEDFAAEIGFFIDVLGFPVGAFSPNYAQFTSPGGDFTFGVASVEGHPGTPPESLSLQFLVDDLLETIQELENRGIEFEHKPVSMDTSDVSPNIAVLRTPHGVRMELWGISQPLAADQPVEQLPIHEESADFWADYPDELPGPEQLQPETFEGLVDTGDDEKPEDSLPEEPVYVDEEEDVQSELITVTPVTPPQQARPAFPTTIIRRAEDLVKDGIPITGRKTKGNGMRGFPTLNDVPDGQEG